MWAPAVGGREEGKVEAERASVGQMAGKGGSWATRERKKRMEKKRWAGGIKRGREGWGFPFFSNI
jgi:hypothetical protein